jgi:hypothetical protein
MATTDIRQFGTASKRGEDRGEDDLPLDVYIAERKVTLHSPGSGQLAYLAASLSGFDSSLQQVGSLINFIANIMDDDDAKWFQRSLLDNDIDFEAEDVLDLCRYLIEEWSEDRPTKPSRASASSQRPTGQRSTEDTRPQPTARRRSSSVSPAS